MIRRELPPQLSCMQQLGTLHVRTSPSSLQLSARQLAVLRSQLPRLRRVKVKGVTGQLNAGLHAAAAAVKHPRLLLTIA